MASGVMSAGVLLGSCSWSEFDDLKKDSWVQLLERDDSGATGDFGIEVTALPVATGVRFVVSAGDPVGLSQVTFNEKGESTEVTGDDAGLSGTGRLMPLERVNGSIPLAIVPYTSTTLLVGVPQSALIARLDTGLVNGTTVVKNTTILRIGDALAVGNLGLGSASPDIAAVGSTFLTVIPNGQSAGLKSCAMSAPSKVAAPVVPLENVKVATIEGAPRIVVSGLDATAAAPRIFILDAAQVQDQAPCPTGTSFTTAVGAQPPVSVQVADVNGNGTPDIIAGFLGAGTGDGKVIVYLDVTRSAAPTAVEITSVDNDLSSSLRGSRIRVADIEGDAKPEIIVGDAAASPEGVSSAGQVQIYNFGTAGCAAADVRGAGCLVRTLADSSPEKDHFFGRGLAIGTFNGKNILAVTQKDMLLVYFRISAAMADTRMK